MPRTWLRTRDLADHLHISMRSAERVVARMLAGPLPDGRYVAVRVSDRLVRIDMALVDEWLRERGHGAAPVARPRRGRPRRQVPS